MNKCPFDEAFEIRLEDLDEDRLWEEILAGISDEDKRSSNSKSL